MFCEQCGKKINDNAKFFRYCGYSTGYEEECVSETSEELAEEKVELKEQNKTESIKKTDVKNKNQYRKSILIFFIYLFQV